MKILLCLVMISMVGCASKLIPVEQRSFTAIKKNSKVKSQNFDDAVLHLSVGFKTSKAIKLKDRNRGLIIATGNIQCNVFRQMGDVNNYNLHFDLQLTANTGSKKFKFTNMYIASVYGEPVGWEYNQISSSKKLKEAKKCLNGLMEF